jgi:H+/Cl- antiporter ClcA
MTRGGASLHPAIPLGDIMRKTFLEETVLFVSIIKWAILATLVGLVVGLSTTVFLKALGLSGAAVQGHRYYFLLLPLALFLSSLLVKHLAPDAEGHGTEKVIEAVHKRWGKIKLMVVPVKLVATIITLAFGGSAGKEGPCAQIGAGMASAMADLLKLTKEDRKKLVICGISAGFAAVFGTPIAGALFAVEVLVLGKVLQEVLFPALVAAIVSFQIATSFGIHYFHQAILLPRFSQLLFMEMLLAGVFFGLVALLLVEALKLAETYAKKLPVGKPWLGLVGGALLAGLALIFSPLYLGLGVETLEAAINGGPVPPLAFLGKILFTAITLSMGGSGGILTPVFFIGSTAGSALAQLFHLNTGAFAAIGMVALLAGAANTPIAASVMAIEIFGPQIGPYAAIACLVSYTAAGHRSVYASQILGVSKSASINVPLMKELEKVEDLEIRNQPGKILYLLRKALFRKNS